MHIRKVGSYILFTAFYLFLVLVRGQQQDRTPAPAVRVFQARGITVGIPRAFDNRTLTLMLDTLNDSLSRFQVIDQTSIAKAIGAIQGSRVQESASNFTIQGSPTPALTQEQNTSRTLSPSSEGLIATAGTDTTKQTVSQPTVTPAIPSAGDLASPPSAFTNLQYGMNSTDLLSEQVDITYQIFNLRMLLDRSLSDRILWSESKGDPRLQTVIGLNVTLDPPRDAENAVAVVEVTLYQDGKRAADRPSLVAVMPQEHTYNAAALNSKANAFGGSAVIKLVNVGFSERRRGQTYYLFRDNDTVSFERQANPDDGTTTFGWAFRPVLGRKSVSPGPRQMFAVVSLPVADIAGSSEGTRRAPLPLKADIKAYWRKYDQGSLTSASDHEVRPMGKLAYALSLGTRLTYAPGGQTSVSGYDIQVPFTSAYLSVLKPTINKINWRATGDKQAVISVEGSNLYQGTRIALADKTYDATASALRLQPDQAFDITTELAALRTDGTVLGRYGSGVPLEKSPPVVGPLTINSIVWDSALGGVAILKIYPGLNSGSLPVYALSDDNLGQPIVAVGGTVIPGSYEVVSTGGNVEYFAVAVPQSVVKDISGMIQLKFPFRGRQFEASARAYDPSTQFSVRLLGSKLYLIERLSGPWNGTAANEPKYSDWRIQVNGETISLIGACSATGTMNEFCTLTPNDRFTRLRLEKEAPDTAVVLFTKQKAEGSYPVTLPKEKPEAPKPELDKNQTATVNQNDAVWITFKGKALSAVGTVTASGVTLETRPGEKDDSILILVSRDITAKGGTVDLAFRDKQAKVIGTATVSIKPVSDPKGQPQ